MSVKCKLLKYPEGNSAAEDKVATLMSETIHPRIKAFWDEYGKPFYDHEYAMNVMAFMTMWRGKGIKLFIAERDGQVVGFMLCAIFQPLFMVTSSILQIEAWDADDFEAEEALFNYFLDTLDVLDVHQVWMDDHLPRADHLKCLPKLKSIVTNRYKCLD